MKTLRPLAIGAALKCWLAIALAVSPPCSLKSEENPKLQGKGEVTCKGGKANPSEIEEATRKAKLDVLARYIASTDEARQANLTKVRPALENSIESHLVGVNPLANNFDKKTRLYTTVVEAQVNLGSVEQELRKAAGATATAASASKERQMIAFVFVARREASITEKGPKTATRQTDFKETQDQERQLATTAETSAVSRSKAETASVTESSVTRSADTVAYDVAPSEGIDSAMSAVFASGGFDTVPSSELYSATDGAFDLKKFIADYRTGDDISQETRKMATDSCRKVEVPFVAFGTLTLQLKEKDPVTGQTAVGVVVNGQVWDVRKKLAIKAASIGPVQYQALGKSQTEAEQEALKDAGQKAARALVDQLRARGIQ